MIPTYGGVLSAIEKALQELMREYREVEKFLQNLVESLERIGAAMEQRWGLEEENGKEKSRDNMEGSEEGPRKIQEKKTPLFTSC